MGEAQVKANALSDSSIRNAVRRYVRPVTSNVYSDMRNAEKDYQEALKDSDKRADEYNALQMWASPSDKVDKALRKLLRSQNNVRKADRVLDKQRKRYFNIMDNYKNN